MKEIVTLKGEVYSFNEETGRIFKDGILIPESQAEPIYSAVSDDFPPKFSGIYLKNQNVIVSVSGKVNQVSDINSIKKKK